MNDTPTPLPSGYLDTYEAAEYLRLSRRRMDQYRAEGDGPRFRKFGQKIVYTVADLEAWSAEHAYKSLEEVDGTPRKRRTRRVKK